MIKEGYIIGERYEVISRIGSGGMADVYKAKDLKLNRLVAVKVLKQEFRADKKFISKFRSEAQAAAGLSHPNIVNVFDVGNDDNIYFIVMELVEGITLKDYITKKGKLSIKEATSIAIQVSLGLEAAHARNIVHRDIKPQNIIISTDGKVKLSDFGIARVASSNTISSNAMGSVHYSSPEQVRGGYSDAKSDIYSLGITLYEMVTGRVPFDGETTVAIAIKHLQEEMVPPSQYTPDLPRSLEQIILKCTQKSVDRRYNNITEVIEDLKHSLMDPNGNFVKLAPLSSHARTVMISEEDMDAIRSGRTTPSQDERDRAERERRRREEERRARYEYEDEDEEDEDGEEDEYEEDEDDDDNGGISSKLEKALIIGGFVIVAIIICILIYFIGQAAGFFSFGSNDEKEQNQVEQNVDEEENSDKVAVPNLVNMTIEEAQEEAQKYGLTLSQSGTAASDSIPAGSIISTDPVSGTEVDKNSTVQYVLSTGAAQAETAVVPDVMGDDWDTAYAALVNAGFTVQAGEETDGTVVDMDPSAGEEVAVGTQITLTISGSGADTATIPNLIGQTEEDAIASLEAQGFTNIETTEGYDENYNIGDVIAISPARGTEVSLTATITLTINTERTEEPTSTPTPTATPTPDPGGENGTASGSWKCTQPLGQPDDYTGGPVKLELVQTVDGKSQTTTIFEGQTIDSFPYKLNVTGADGVSEGTIIFSEMQDDGTYRPIAQYTAEFKQVED